MPDLDTIQMKNYGIQINKFPICMRGDADFIEDVY